MTEGNVPLLAGSTPALHTYFLAEDMNMLKYLNGKITEYAIPNERVLLIKISRNELGQLLSPVMEEILNQYRKQITVICFIGGEDDQTELIGLLKMCRKAGLKTCMSTYLKDENKLVQPLKSELDYLQLGSKTYKKDYSPFGDAEIWIDV